jgi:hypothetical protein
MDEQNQIPPENPTEGGSLLDAEVTPPTGDAGPQETTQNPTESQNQPTAGESKADEPTEGAPEKYEDFIAPEGTVLDSEVVKGFTDAAKEANLSQEKAQAFINKMSPMLNQRAKEQLMSAKREWEQASRGDKEFGGEKLNENLALAQKAMAEFGSPELKDMLNSSGLGSHPEIIRMFVKAGKAISEDGYVGGRKTDGAVKDPAKVMYPDMN